MTTTGPMREFQIVVAATQSWGIGKNGQLPWNLPGDMAFFKTVTSTTKKTGSMNAVIMGRKTWESIPKKFRPLPNRLNIVLSQSGALRASDDENASPQSTGEVLPASVRLESSLEAALASLAQPELAAKVETVFVIGGAKVYEEALTGPLSALCSAVHLTEVQGEVECDTFIPPLDLKRFRLFAASGKYTAGELKYTFLHYVSKGPDGAWRLPASVPARHEELQYLEMVRDIIDTGAHKGDRTGTGTISKFGCQMRFNLRRSFPLLTTKRVFWRGVAEELLWFISGSTDARKLREKDIHIWDGNGSREYLDSIGLTEREDWDLGPVYGFQWRHFGAKYTDMHADYSGQGVDQLADVIHKIRHNPNDRRILLSAWNPAALAEMALPPCHMFCQFYVADGELSCQMYQRSCDMGLGVPFNIASYALLTCMLAQVCGLKPGDFVHCLGDAHVYSNHVDALQVQLERSPRPFPTLRINPAKTEIDSFVFEDFTIEGYDPHAKIEMKMSA